MCNHGECETVLINAQEIKIDKCLVPYIRGFQNVGIETQSCCCGHGKWDGFIKTKDRLFIVCSQEESEKRYNIDHEDQARYWSKVGVE